MKLLNYLRGSKFVSSDSFTQKIQRKLSIKVVNKELYKEAFTNSSANLKNSNWSDSDDIPDFLTTSKTKKPINLNPKFKFKLRNLHF